MATGCEIMKCIDYKDGKCHYESAMCKYQESRMEGQEAKDLLFEAEDRIKELEEQTAIDKDFILQYQKQVKKLEAEVEQYRLIEAELDSCKMKNRELARDRDEARRKNKDYLEERDKALTDTAKLILKMQDKLKEAEDILKEIAEQRPLNGEDAIDFKNMAQDYFNKE